MANAVTLDELIERVIAGVKEIQAKSPDELSKWLNQQGHLVPPSVPLPHAAHCLITEGGLKALYEFGRRWREEDAERKQRLDAATAEQLSRRVFGEMLDGEAVKNMPPTTDAKDAFKELLKASLEALSHEVEFSFPCRLFDDEQVLPFQVGPVRFQKRADWLKSVADRAKPKIPTWAGVVESYWDGRVSAPPDQDLTARAVTEEFVSNWVAMVCVSGHTRKAAESAAKIAVRIAIDTLGLPLGAPLAQNLRGPGDEIRARLRRTFVQLKGRDVTYSSTLDLPRIARRPGDYAAFISDTARLRDAAGKAVTTLLELKPSARTPELLRRWAEAMHWFGEARREPVPSIALVKFGITLDVLARGTKAGGILLLCCALFDMKEADLATSEGRTLKKLVETIYNEGRSRIAHGGNLFLLADLPISPETADYTVSVALDFYIRFLDVYSGTDDYDAFVQAIPGLRNLI